MTRRMEMNTVIEDALNELEYELESEFEGETGKRTFQWWVSHSPGFGEGYDLLQSLSTGQEQHTEDDMLSRQSAVIQMAYKTLKNSGKRGMIKVERYGTGPDGRLSRDKASDACSKASLDDPPYLKITDCGPFGR
jgi:hypothetical protein